MPLKQTDLSFFAKVRPVLWYESLQFRLSLGLLIVLGILIIAVYAVNQTLLKSVLIENKFDLVEQAGNSLVTELGQQIEATEALTRSIASVGNDLPKDEALYKVVIPHMMDNDNISPFVAGGGVWPEPYSFDAETARRSFFWARKDTPELLYYDDYNALEGNGYHNEEWYVPAKYIGRDKCFWSKSYMDPYSFEPMVTCSVPMQKRDHLTGVATIDLKLSGLQKFFAKRASKLGGYAFAVDRNNKFLSYPDLNLVQGQKDSGQPGDLITVQNFTDLHPKFAPLAKQLNNLSQSVISSAQAQLEYDPNLADLIAEESYQINEDEARMIVATFADPLGVEGSRLETSHRFSVNEDVVLGEPVLVSMFVMPKVYWKIVVVTPQRTAYSDANAVTKKILYILVGILLVSMVGAYFWLRRILVQPLVTMTNEIKDAPLNPLSIRGNSNDSFTEIDVLASTINSMRDQIGQSFEELQASENRFRLIAESLPEGLAITRLSDGVILYLNSRLKDMLAIPEHRSSFDSKLIDFFDDPNDRSRLFRKLKKSNEVSDFVVRAQRLDGGRFWATISTSAVNYAGQPALVSGVLDITNRKEAEEEVIRYKTHLEQMVLDRTSELEEAKTIAVNAAAAKQNFLANMSHEIRTPLNSVVGISHLLLLKDFMPAQKRYLLNLNKSGKILLKIINDILDITKMDAGKLEAARTTFDLNDVLDDISIHIRPMLSDKIIGTYIHRPIDLKQHLIGDPLRLEQVLLNLISNAIKFTHEGHVNVSIALDQMDENWNSNLKIIITDTGIGMTEEQLSSVFQAFTQADNAITREYGGTGLGLTISQNLLSLMGGSLGVQSEYGEGSVFTINIPVGVSKKPLNSPFAQLSTPPKCLIISNDEKETSTIQSILDSWKLPHAAISAESDLGIYLEKEPSSDSAIQFIIADWDDSLKSRAAILKSLKAQNKEVAPKLISLMQSITDAEERMLEQGQIQALLSKPIRAIRLKTTMATLLDLPIQDKDLLFDGDDAEQAKQALAGLNILLVEDNDQNQFVAEEILSSVGATIMIASNGKHALDQLETHGPAHFDLILMDLHMPVMDGFQATMNIQDIYGDGRPPIIALSAEIFDEVIEKCKNVGMDDYLAKPFSPQEMIAAILRRVEKPKHVPTKVAKKHPQEPSKSLSVKKGLSNLDGKDDFYRKLLSQYLEKYENFTTDMENLIEKGDVEDTQRYIHTFGGLSGTIGAVEISKIARAYKKKLKENSDPDEIKKLYISLIDELELVRAGINTYLETKS